MSETTTPTTPTISEPPSVRALADLDRERAERDPAPLHVAQHAHIQRLARQLMDYAEQSGVDALIVITARGPTPKRVRGWSTTGDDTDSLRALGADANAWARITADDRDGELRPADAPTERPAT